MTKRKPGRPKSTERELKMLGVYLTDDTLRKITEHAESEGRRVGAMGRRLIEEALQAREAAVAAA